MARDSSTPALRVLTVSGIAHEVVSYRHDPRSELGYGAEAASALGIDPARVFKTLCVDVDGSLALAVVPVSGRLDLKAAARALGAKRTHLADASRAQRATGYVVGGIAPLGGRTPLPTVIDASALDQPQVLVSAGRRGLDVALDPADLVAISAAQVAPIGQP